MSAIIFLSDIHLSESEKDIHNAFFKCIHTLCEQRPEGVFILGDLFDAWIGDKLETPFTIKVAEQIHQLSQICPVFFQKGNRDFLIGSDYLDKAGMTLIPDSYQLTLDQQRILLQHGDLLCSDDVSYQKLRKILRSKWLIKLSEILPTFFCIMIAKLLRKKSKQYTQQKNQSITDVNQQTVQQIMKQFDINILIHGHTHRPQLEIISPSQKRYVLGDWRPFGEVLTYENGQWKLDFIHSLDSSTEH